ncbi:hypothetical protein ACIPPQ_20755 [Sphingopyxis sp. LARHCG72]
MSLLDEARADRIAARFGRTVAIDYADFDPGDTQICLSVGRLIHDDDCVKVLAGSAMLVGGEGLRMSGVIEIPARCVVRIVRLEEV